MSPWKWKFGRLAIAHERGVEVAGYRRLFWRLYWGKTRQRISGARPSTTAPCDWCHEVRPTTISEVWSEASPEGRLVRLCEECGAMCGGG
jgi:hypothetical protein